MVPEPWTLIDDFVDIIFGVFFYTTSSPKRNLNTETVQPWKFYVHINPPQHDK